MLGKINLEPILIKYVVGNTIDTTPKPIYSDIVTIKGLIVDNTQNEIVYNAYGNVIEYDKKIIINTKIYDNMINYDTAMYIYQVPTNLYPNGDCDIKYIGKPKLNTFTIYVKQKSGIDIPKIYFERDNQICQIQFNFDKSILIGYIPNNQYIPFDENTKIWDRKPTDINSTKNLLRLISIEKHNKYFKKLTFEKVAENETIRS